MTVCAIGLTGSARSGKDLVAMALHEHIWQYGEERVAVHVAPLADNVKWECAQATGLQRHLFDDPKHKEVLRPLLQWWGTEFRRNPRLGGHPGYWIDGLMARIERAKTNLEDDHNHLVVIVPDVRFENEAEAIHGMDGQVVAIRALNANTTPHAGHSSEQGLPDHCIDASYYNDHAKGRGEVVRIAEEIYLRCLLPWIERTSS